MKKLSILWLIVITMVMITSCKKGEEPVVNNLVYGKKAALGNGYIRSFVRFERNLKDPLTLIPEAIGVRFNASALNGLPSSLPEYETPVALPSEAKGIGIDHIEVDWNPNGHEPDHIYTFPHFDFHFYMITLAEQAAVVPGPDLTPVDRQYVPKDYMSGVVAVPNMGVHWVDSLAPEFHGQMFTSTFIYGFYHGEMTFLEPMATKAFIETKPSYAMTIKQPMAFQRHGYYPTVLKIWYDSQQKEYEVALSGLQYH